MKTFIFTEEERKTRRTYGGANVTLKVFRVVRNEPVLLGTVKYCTSATMGAISEVNRFLIDNKEIPKSWSKRMSYDSDELYETNYYDYGRHQNKYRIIDCA